MRTLPVLARSVLALTLMAAALLPARADFELSDANGRRILLKDNGTWSYVDAAGAPKEAASAASPAVPEVQADLELSARVDAPGGCRFALTLSNNLPYEIGSLVPEIAALRANNVVYASKLVAFASVRPGDKQVRQVRFEGIGCQDIARLQVLGADRCEMGELNKFTDAKGRCLAMVRVVPSALLPYAK
jgi:hypothetical protein